MEFSPHCVHFISARSMAAFSAMRSLSLSVSVIPAVPSVSRRIPSSLRFNRVYNASRKVRMRSDFLGGNLQQRQIGRRVTSRRESHPKSSAPQTERSAKTGLQFLLEQPGQLQHIEWPSFQTVGRMAVLTLIVVTCLIILLATIDSTMSFVLASVLRRVP